MIRRFIRRTARVLEEVRLTIIVMWRTLNGRWYVYRDMPDWLVFSHAALSIEDDDDELGTMLAMARAEQKLRLERITREIDRLAAKITEATKR